MPVSSSYVTYLRHHIDFSEAGVAIHAGLLQMIQEAPETKKDETAKQALRTRWLMELSLFAFNVNSFQTYLAQIIEEIISKRPQLLGNKQFKAKTAFEFEDINTLRGHIIDRYISELGYQSIDRLTDFLNDSLGLELVKSNIGRVRLGYILQVRNLITHNRGIVNQVFIDRTGSKRHSIGDRLPNPPNIYVNRYLNSIARSIDRQAISKFGVDTGKPQDFLDDFWSNSGDRK